MCSSVLEVGCRGPAHLPQSLPPPTEKKGRGLEGTKQMVQEKPEPLLEPERQGFTCSLEGVWFI